MPSTYHYLSCLVPKPRKTLEGICVQTAHLYLYQAPAGAELIVNLLYNVYKPYIPEQTAPVRSDRPQFFYFTLKPTYSNAAPTGKKNYLFFLLVCYYSVQCQLYLHCISCNCCGESIRLSHSALTG